MAVRPIDERVEGTSHKCQVGESTSPPGCECTSASRPTPPPLHGRGRVKLHQPLAPATPSVTPPSRTVRIGMNTPPRTIFQLGQYRTGPSYDLAKSRAPKPEIAPIAGAPGPERNGPPQRRSTAAPQASNWRTDRRNDRTWSSRRRNGIRIRGRVPVRQSETALRRPGRFSRAERPESDSDHAAAFEPTDRNRGLSVRGWYAESAHRCIVPAVIADTEGNQLATSSPRDSRPCTID